MSIRKTRPVWHGPCYKGSIMHKNTATLHGSLPNMASFGSMFHGIVTKARDAVRIHIPIGYQDETGFHMGVKPAESEIKWPQVW